VACKDENLNLNLTQKEDARRFAEALYGLNCDAMTQRYGKAALQSDRKEQGPFVFQLVERSPVAVYKAACCLIYQCSEGDVPERDLFKVLNEIPGQIAIHVAQSHPEYESAPWGD
jgi:hypothetical protein